MNASLKATLRIMTLILIGLMAALPAAAEYPDFGDRCNQAYAVDTPSATWGYLTQGDKDYFEIVVGGAGTLTVFTTGTTDTIGTLYNSNCNQITSHDDISWPQNTNFQIVRTLSAGTYYVKVDAYKKTQGVYQLNVFFDGQQNHTITASAAAGGTISPSGAQSVAHSGNLSFTVTPDFCYIIGDLQVDGESKGPRNYWNFTDVTADHTIHAVFETEDPFTIAASAETGGTISPSGNVPVRCGEQQTFTIEADANHEILDVVVDGTSRGAISSHTFNSVGDAHTITARFKERDQYTITTIPGDNGSISPAGPVSVYGGSSPTFAIVPYNGFAVQEVWIDGTSHGPITAYTFFNVQRNHTIEARFKVDDSGGSTGSGCLEISDTPLDAQFRSAPPIIMFVIDDSGSMDWEVMTAESHSRFGSEGISYVFDDPGDNVYTADYGYAYSKILSDSQRKDWKAQWSGYNKMYYNPRVLYEPWPNMGPADTVAPLSHPKVEGLSLNLADTYLEMNDADSVIVDDGDPEFSVSGAWNAYYYSYAYNSDYRYSTLRSENKVATWKPNLTTSGWYKVYARWINTGANSDQVIYQLSGTGATAASVPTNQARDFYEWNYLGTQWFDSNGYVQLTLDAATARYRYAVADAVKFVPVTDANIKINNAHYYTFHDVNGDGVMADGETLYLVNFVDDNADGKLDRREWYVVEDDGDDHIQKSELYPIAESGLPEAVRPRSISADLQNFANWYTYYRRRELSATAAVASVIDQADRMLIGIHSINGLVNEPVHRINVDGVDERDALLDKLYGMVLSALGTPLRRGLQNVGKYLDKTDGGDTGGIGTAPWFSSQNGGACQQAFTIVMTDGYYNGSEPWSPEKNIDGDNGSPYADDWSNTLADVAMYYYEKDLVHDDELQDLVPTNDRDKAGYQHMVTYGVGFGVSGTLNPADYDFVTTSPAWPDPNPKVPDADTDKRKIDDLWHAAVNGRGRFLTSSDSIELLNDLLMVFKDIEFYAGSASSVSVNGDELYTKMNDRVMLFQAKYYSETWHGDVLAYRVNKVTGAIEDPAIWSAAKQLSHKSADERLIATSNGRNAGKEFRHDRITHTMRQMLSADDAMAATMLSYIRGDGANEVANGGTFRNRTWRINDPNHPSSGQTIASAKLGDVVHSSPVYKNGALYAGGNDGMLHAFNAATGEEMFAYVPYLVFGHLKELADPDYDHKFYVDLTPAAADVSLSNGTRVMLVGGLGKGGKGYYALDISAVDPERGSVPGSEYTVKNMVMWEYPNLLTPAEEIADMGYSFSHVTIAKSHDTDDAPYMVIFGNGYNSDNGNAVLFILNPVNGKLLKKIDTGAVGCNGLSTPIAVDVDFDSVVDYVYAGDLRGNLWKFDLTNPDYNLWDVAYADGSIPRPLFTTTGTNSQPITTRPDVMKHCTRDGYMVFFGTGKYLEETDLNDTSLQAVYAVWDFGEDVDDSEYVGVWDNVNETLTNAYLPTGVGLQDQDASEYTVGSQLIRVLTDFIPDWTTTTLSGGGQCGDFNGNTSCDMYSPGEQAEPAADVAWFMNLPGSGERIVSDLLIREGKLLVISYTPEGSMCGTGGSSWLMEMNACTGARLNSSLFDLDDDGDIDDADEVKINPGTGELVVVPTGINFDGRLQPPAIIIFGNNTEVLYMSSSQGVINTQRQKAARLGMIYWRIFRP